MICNCKNCAYACETKEGILCEKRLAFVHPQHSCEGFEDKEELTVWNTPLTWVAIGALVAVVALIIIL